MIAPTSAPQSAPEGAKDLGRALRRLRQLKRAAVDLFAGPGGWDVAAHLLGLDVVGVEWDHAACETRRAVGHRTVEADVADVDIAELVAEHWDDGKPAGLIASPPCQTFSSAGSGAGREMLAELCAVARLRLGVGNGVQLAAAEIALADADPRSLLVLEPIRWIRTLEPRWIALEQVPSVLPIWEAYAEGLRAMGYSVWTGILTAERYGVPQTRKRAILVASLDREVREPQPTHKRYVPPKKDRDDMDSLFGEETPERGRITAPGDEGLREWVSMAEALGWGMTHRPDLTVAVGTGAGGPDSAAVGGSAARATLYGERDAGRWKEPVERVEPVEPVPVAYNARDQRDGRTGKPNRQRTIEEPAPTIAVESRNDSWVFERPSTTVACDPRVAPPGWRGKPDDYDAEGNFIGERSMDRAIRVTEEQAAVLQSFPAAYPWWGTKSKRFEQIGNAVPPFLASGVLKEVTGWEAGAMAKGACS